VSTRAQNEKKFQSWDELSGGRRMYVRKIAGRTGGFARYCKEVDDAERTVRFWQEIYDRNGKLVARHEKFPVDTGHQSV
jgi:hypothetical protein